MNQNPSATRRPGPAGVVFDLDGTITRPRLDFEAIRTEIGLAPDLPILEQLVAADAALRSPRDAWSYMLEGGSDP